MTITFEMASPGKPDQFQKFIEGRLRRWPGADYRNTPENYQHGAGEEDHPLARNKAAIHNATLERIGRLAACHAAIPPAISVTRSNPLRSSKLAAMEER